MNATGFVNRIRAYKPDDLQAVLDIWLTASVKAHNFISEAFWQDQLPEMEEVYLPASKVFVCTDDDTDEITGFAALYDNSLAALFVHPDYQGRGQGSALLKHAMAFDRKALTLTVYKANQPAIDFYTAHGFEVERRQTDPHTGEPEYLMAYASGGQSRY